MWPFKSQKSRRDLTVIPVKFSREEKIRTARISVIDDETPLLIHSLREIGFAVDHDMTGDDLSRIDDQLYDLAIVDFYGVGRKLGEGQGLEIVKHLRRVSPRTRILAYTSKSIDAKAAEFFRLSDGVLLKDAGWVESLRVIEDQIDIAYDKEHIFNALADKLNLKNEDARMQLKEAVVESLHKGDKQRLKDRITKIAGTVAEKGTAIIINKLFQGLDG